MKTFKSIFFALTVLSFVLSSCNKENIDVDTEDLTMTTDEAAENVEALMVTAVNDVEEVAKMAEESYEMESGEWAISCGETIDTTWSKSQGNGTASADYTSTWELTVLCNNFNIPNALAMKSNANGHYEGPLISGNETGVGEYSLNGLLPSSLTYDLEGSYVASGTADAKKGRMASYSFTCTIQFTNISFDKETNELLSGEGTVELVASSQNAGPATFTGAAIFNGDGTVTVTLNGKEYTFPI